MNLGVIGLGVVGKALYYGFKEKGHTVYLNDTDNVDEQYQEDFRLKEEMVENCEIIFICVPTPIKNGGGCDLSIVYEVFNALHYHIAQRMRKGPIVPPIIAVKSTVIPGTVDSLKAMYHLVCSNPEFLRSNHAFNDFLYPDRIVVGTDNEVILKTMKKLYDDWGCPILFVKPKEAEMIKYLSNTFLLLKVAYSEEARLLCERFEIDPEIVMYGVTSDNRINGSHLQPVGAMPKDSPCLPKDAYALIKLALSVGYDPWLLKAALLRGVEGAKMETKIEVSI